jgi:hypothetical protein
MQVEFARRFPMAAGQPSQFRREIPFVMKGSTLVPYQAYHTIASQYKLLGATAKRSYFESHGSIRELTTAITKHVYFVPGLVVFHQKAIACNDMRLDVTVEENRMKRVKKGRSAG